MARPLKWEQVSIFGDRFTDLKLYATLHSDISGNIDRSLLQQVSRFSKLLKLEVMYHYPRDVNRYTTSFKSFQMQSLEHLSRLTSLTHLNITNIDDFDVSGEQLVNLSASWGELRYLSLRIGYRGKLESDIPIDCLVGLLRNMPHLNELYIPCTKITPSEDYSSFNQERRSGLRGLELTGAKIAPPGNAKIVAKFLFLLLKPGCIIYNDIVDSCPGLEDYLEGDGEDESGMVLLSDPDQ